MSDSHGLFDRAGGWLRHLIHTLVHPEHDGEKARLDEVARHVRKQQASQREGFQRLSDSLARLTHELARRPSAVDFRELRQHVGDLRHLVQRENHLVVRALKDRARLDELRIAEDRTLRHLERIARGGGPVIVGPWTGEVGFELLYWVPFLRWVQSRYGLRSDRLVVVSRGGPRAWYGDLGGDYADAFSFFSTDEFRAWTERARKKQRRVSEFDRLLLRRVVTSRGLTRAHLLHPALMYELLYPFWKHKASLRHIESYTAQRPLAPAPDAELPAHLPTEYVAVRFYFSECFPDTPRNRELAADVIESLASQTDVVLLNPSVAVDDHRDVVSTAHPRVQTIAGQVTAERNLAVQSAVISRARAFVGTYGGYAYLAPHYGINALAFYSDRTFKVDHLEMAQRVFLQPGFGSLVALETSSASIVATALNPLAGHWPADRPVG